MRIALLEDDVATAQLLTAWIQAAGHNVYHFERGKALLQALQRESFDLLLLDWLLPDIPGDEVLKQIREQRGWSVPVVFITQRDTAEDIVLGLNSGADDYITKPVRPDELLARLHAVARRFGGDVKESAVQFSPYSFDLRSHSVSRDGKALSLTQKEFDLALFIFRHAGQLLSRAHLLENVWGRNASVTTRTVDIHLSRLRRKLSLGDGSGWRLCAVYNYGYRLESVSAKTYSMVV